MRSWIDEYIDPLPEKVNLRSQTFSHQNTQIRTEMFRIFICILQEMIIMSIDDSIY